ncbi:hypothetical protein PTW37_06625 [Arthrobacter agilis]|uniref:hypothetical protein n=1 Tax=Arthrobacter agilis TaxID=37921 RepID=UPI0023657F99|nr:hypothetical protein [Arthrobacter agilis]WDF34569.1 hypothetical protein PTW37_06625 [Arthrobacter agilis]
MISLEQDDKPDNLLDIGDGLVIMRSFRATIAQDASVQWGPDRKSAVGLHVEWNQEKFTYEISMMFVAIQDGGEPINGTLMRAIPVQMLLKLCITRALYAKDVGDSAAALTRIFESPLNDDGEMRRLAELGPRPETLAWVARAYTIARIKLDHPSKHVSKLFEIPPRTASHWVKLARERGHLTI